MSRSSLDLRRRARATRRAAAMVGVFGSYGLYEALCHRFIGRDLYRCLRIVEHGACVLLDAMGVDVTVYGSAPKGALLVSNHCSYADIVIICAHSPTTFLAKSEVAHWPVIGPTATAVGTVYVQRDSAESRRASRDRVRERIEEGIAITVFPEGTTTAGPSTLDFRPGIFATAVAAELSVVPVAIAYHDPRDAWVGDVHFMAHFMDRFRGPSMKVSLSYGPVMRGDDVEALRSGAQRWVREELARLHAAEGSRYDLLDPSLLVGSMEAS